MHPSRSVLSIVERKITPDPPSGCGELWKAERVFSSDEFSRPRLFVLKPFALNPFVSKSSFCFQTSDQASCEMTTHGFPLSEGDAIIWFVPPSQPSGRVAQLAEQLTLNQ
jgi:hypothetical protein